MTPDLLKAFVAVAESGGFSAAAGLLNRTQSAVSLQIKRLEAELGTALFERTSRSVALTPQGSRLLPYARRLLRLQRDAEEALTAGAAPETLRFGLPEEQAAAYLPVLLPLAAETHPRLRIEIVCEVSSALVERFEKGLLDVVLAVRHGPSRTGRTLGLERMIWVAHPDFRPPADAPLPLALNPEGCIYRAHALATLGRLGRSWREPYVSASPTGVNAPVQAGLALTVKTPRSIPRGCAEAGQRLGLPELGQIEIEQHASPALVGETQEWFAKAVARIVQASETVKGAPIPSE